MGMLSKRGNCAGVFWDRGAACRFRSSPKGRQVESPGLSCREGREAAAGGCLRRL